jgi:CRP-like cAMP-binding protein
MDETHDLLKRAQRSVEEAQRVGAETRRLVQTSREIQHWTARVQGRVAGEIKSFSFDRTSNRLLALLPPADFEGLVPLLQGVVFTRKQVVHRANSKIEYVYFPISGLLSAMLSMDGGDSIEVAPIGNEGMVGLPAVVGAGGSPYDVVVQIPGSGLRTEIGILQAELNRGGLLRDIIAGYQNARNLQDTYQIACNGLHSVSRRCCRQLLNIQDRIASDVLPVTHDSLALTLGVRRSTVTDELGTLQSQRVIEARRGEVRIVDRSKLQALSCECYQAVTQEFVSLLRSNGSENRDWPRVFGSP